MRQPELGVWDARRMPGEKLQGRQLRVALDGTPLLGRITGIGLTVRELLENLVAFDELDLRAYAVTFQLWGQGLEWSPVAGSRSGPHGWVARWHTTTVGDGAYYLRSVVSTSSGVAYEGRAVEIFVQNR